MTQGRGEGPHRELGQWFRDLRVRARLNSQPLAVKRAKHMKLWAVTQGKLSYLERGWNAQPEMALLHELAALYGVSYEELVVRCVEAQYGVKLVPETGADRKALPTPAPVIHFDAAERRLLQHYRRLPAVLQRRFASTIKEIADLQPPTPSCEREVDDEEERGT